MNKGKFIVFYGVNNIGKSLQQQLLSNRLEKEGIETKAIKYPVYDLSPTGPLLNRVIREGMQMPEIQIQTLFSQNRRDFQSTLLSYLQEDFDVIAEDYTGTGIAWGLVRGLSLEILEKLNADLVKEDVGILLHGSRFVHGKEANHRNESDDSLVEKAQEQHLFLAKRYGWYTINVNQPPETVHNEIWNILQPVFR